MNLRTRDTVILLVVLAVVGQASAGPKSAAERLAECMPDRSMLVVAWSGSDQVREQWDKTAMGKILAEPTVRTFVAEIKKAIWNPIDAELTDPADRVALQTLRDAWPVLVRSPGALVVAAGDPQADFAVSLALVLDAAKSRGEIDAMLARVNTVTPPAVDVQIGGVSLKSYAEAGITSGWIGERFVLGLGDLSPLVASLETGKRALSASSTFAGRMAAVPVEHEVLLVYGDVDVTTRLLKDAAGGTSEQEAVQSAESVLTVLGLADVDAALLRVSVRGPEMIVNASVFAPAPRRGVWKCLDGRVELDRMKDVPSGATMAGAGTFRISEVLPLVTAAVRAAAPKHAETMAKEIDRFEQDVGVAIRKNLLPNFAGPYTYYFFPVNNALVAHGGVVLFDVNDGTMMEAGLAELERWAAKQLPPNLVSAEDRLIGDQKVTLHTWNLLAVNVPLQVGWAVCKGKLVFELSAGTIGGAVEHLVAGGPSLVDDPAFAAVAGRYAPVMSHYSFSNDMLRAGSALQQLAAIWTMLQMGLKQSTDIVLPFLPPSSDIVRHLGVTTAYSYIDESGMHTRAAGSMPAGDPVIVTASAAALTSIMLPSLSRARELSKRLVSAANLKGIGTCCKIYAIDNEDRFPPSLQTLIDSGDITPKQLLNPRVGNPDKPNHYIYIPGHTEAGEPSLIVAYENPAYVDEGINVLYLDGHVEFLRGESAFAPIRATYEKMGLAVPDLAYKAGPSTRFLDKFNPQSAGTRDK